MSRCAGAQAALTFRLARQAYAIPLHRTCGVRDLGPVRKIPDASPAWVGVADWSGHLLSVIDVPLVLEDRGVQSVRTLVRLREPNETLALYLPSHLGLTQVEPPESDGHSALTRPIGAEPNLFHWIDLDALIEACAQRAVP